MYIDILHEIKVLRYMREIAEESFAIKKVENTVSGTYVASDINIEEIVEKFFKKELQKSNQKEFRVEKVIREKAVNYMLNGEDLINRLIAG